jgi:hypothetical protein
MIAHLVLGEAQGVCQVTESTRIRMDFNLFCRLPAIELRDRAGKPCCF